MADWTPPPYPQLVAGKPWTDEKASAAFENVEALAQGKPGAPYIETAWHPYDSAAVGDGNTGLLWDFATDGVPADFDGPLFEDGFTYKVVIDRFTASGLGGASSKASVDVRVIGAVSGSTSAVEAGFGGTGAGTRGPANSFAEFEAARSEVRSHYYVSSGAPLSVESATPQKLLRFRLDFTQNSGGTITAGRVRMFRKRLYE